MEYRDIKYNYEEWITYSGETASCFSCSDKRLLKGLGMKYISDKTENQMKRSIDFYIDQRPTLLKAMELERKAGQEFYDKLNYKGD
jgi:hypothetical protein